jgi:hypothetical protein
MPLKRRAGSGSVFQWYGNTDPEIWRIKNIRDPEHCQEVLDILFLAYTYETVYGLYYPLLEQYCMLYVNYVQYAIFNSVRTLTLPNF